jgi:hypothetical protein
MFKKSKYLWKSMQAGMKSAHGDINWKIGQWEKEKEAVKCSKGFHASENIIDAMGFVNCEVLARVEVKGKVDKEKDKQCWTEMKIVEAYQWDKNASVKLSIFAAELCLKNFEKVFPDDKRPREAIEATKKWLAEPTQKNQDAAARAAWSAESAARAAAESAAWSAESAAWSAESAAWSAAWSARAARAAWSAAARAAESAESAESADKILFKCHEFILEEIIPTLKPYKK